jgi:hypothetical protein
LSFDLPKTGAIRGAHERKVDNDSDQAPSARKGGRGAMT